MLNTTSVCRSVSVLGSLRGRSCADHIFPTMEPSTVSGSLRARLYSQSYAPSFYSVCPGRCASDCVFGCAKNTARTPKFRVQSQYSSPSRATRFLTTTKCCGKKQARWDASIQRNLWGFASLRGTRRGHSPVNGEVDAMHRVLLPAARTP